MQPSDMNLDSEAIELYRQLEGIDPRELEKISFTGDGFSQGLSEAEMRNDAIRMLLADFVRQVSRSLLRNPEGKKRSLQSRTFDNLKYTVEKLAGSAPTSKTILIRYKENDQQADGEEIIDYEVVFGEYYLDLAGMQALAHRKGWEDDSQIQQLTAAFQTLWKRSVYNLLLRMPKEETAYKRLWISLQILYRYQRALDKGSAVQFKMGGRKISYPVVTNESGKPDPNLTLLAIFNKLPSDKIQTLVKKVTAMMQKAQKGQTQFAFTTAYDAILELKNLKGKLRLPPLELNNVKWLLVDNEQKNVSDDMARVTRHVVDNFGDSVPKASRVLKSVYGDDYRQIDSNQVAQRLELTSDLLNTMDQKEGSPEVQAEVLDNVSSRLEDVKDGIYDNLVVEGNQIEAHVPGKKAVISQVQD